MNKKELLEKLSSSEELVKLAYVPVSEVIKWINELEEPAAEMDWSILKDALVDEIEGEGIDLFSDYSLEMYDREVELSDVTYDRNSIRRAVDNAIESYKGSTE